MVLMQFPLDKLKPGESTDLALPANRRVENVMGEAVQHARADVGRVAENGVLDLRQDRLVRTHFAPVLVFLVLQTVDDEVGSGFAFPIFQKHFRVVRALFAGAGHVGLVERGKGARLELDTVGLGRVGQTLAAVVALVELFALVALGAVAMELGAARGQLLTLTQNEHGLVVLDALRAAVVLLGRREEAVGDDTARVGHAALSARLEEPIGAESAPVSVWIGLSTVFAKLGRSGRALAVVRVEVVRAASAHVRVPLELETVLDVLGHALVFVVQIKGFLAEEAAVAVQQMRFTILGLLHEAVFAWLESTIIRREVSIGAN